MKENETKLIERYDHWVCEKCGYETRPSCCPLCPGCGRRVIEDVPLDAGVI